MKCSLTIDGLEHTLELTRQGGVVCVLDGEAFDAQVAEVAPGVYSLLLGGQSFHARVAERPSGDSAEAGAKHYAVEIDGRTIRISIRDPRRWRQVHSRSGIGGRQNITAPMPGKVIRILVSERQQVEAGQGLIVVEAMKMQNEIKSPAPGIIEKVLVLEGQAVNGGATLLVMG